MRSASASLPLSVHGLSYRDVVVLLHAWLQRSCCVVQLRVQAAAPPELGVGIAVGVLAACPAATQPFWQVMTAVSQPTRQAVDACEDISGLGDSGTGATWPGVTTCASRIRSAADAADQAKVATKIASRRT